MKAEINTAWIWENHKQTPSSVHTVSPEEELDGDKFRIWYGADGIRMNFENYDGQAREAAIYLTCRHPELETIDFSEYSPCDAYENLREVAENTGIPVRKVSDIVHWFHGTSSACLSDIISDGLCGNLPREQRVWKNVADPEIDTTYVAVSPDIAKEYARKATDILGGEPVILRLSGADMQNIPVTPVEDRDFRHTEEWTLFRAGGMPEDISAADASLTYTDKIGMVGIIPASVFTGVYELMDDEWVLREISTPSLNS